MRHRVAQPPINPSERDREQHDFWPGFIVALSGALVLVCGLTQSTGIDTVEGGSATGLQLIKSFSSGGLQYADLAAPPPIGDNMDPAAAAEAMERWERANAKADGQRWKVRVNTGASAPCPT